MPGDDDVLIKIATDLGTTIQSVQTLLDSLKSVGTVLTTVGSTAEGSGDKLQAVLEGVKSFAPAAGDALQAIGQDLKSMATGAEAAAASTEKFAATTTGALTETATITKGMEEAVAALHRERAYAAAEYASLSEKERADTAAMAEELLKSGKSYKEVGEAAGLSAEAVKSLVAEQQELKQTTDELKPGLEGLKEASEALHKQQIADRTSIITLTKEEKKQTADLAKELLASGQSYKQVASSAKLTETALKSLLKEQQDLADKSKGFFQKWIEGMKGSEVATVTAGVLMADALKQVGSAVLDLVKGFPKMIMAAAEAGDHLQTMANRFNISVEAIAEMTFVADQANVSMESMAKTSQKLASQLGDDTSKASKGFAELGLNAEKLREHPEQALYEFIAAVKATVPEADQAAKMTEVLGNKAGALTGLLKENIPALIADAKALGASAEATRIVAAEGEAYKDNLGRIKLAQEGWRDEMAAHFLPTINKVLHALPDLGGGVLTVGEAMWSAGEKMLPLIGNLALLSSSKVGQSIVTWAGNLVGLTTATQAATVATGEAEVAVWGLNAALGPLAIAIGAVWAIWESWKGASKETGWLRDLSDEMERVALRTTLMSEADIDAQIKQEHATQKAKEAAEAAKKIADAKAAAAAAAKKAQEDEDRAAAKKGDATQRLLKDAKEVQDAYKGLTAAQRAAIKAADDTGKSSKEIATVLHGQMKVSTDVATAAIDLYKKSLKDAETESKKGPFADLAKDAKQLTVELGAAAKAGIPLNEQITQYGKQAEDIVKRATLQGSLNQVSASVKAMAAEFNKAELDKKLEPLNKKALELATTFNTKVTAATTAATTAVTAMNDEMTANLLVGEAAREAAIQRELNASRAATAAKRVDAATDMAAEIAKIKETTKDRIKEETESAKAAGRAVNQEMIARLKTEEATTIESYQTRNISYLATLAQQDEADKKRADQKLKMDRAETESYEKNAELRGVQTQKMAEEELAREQKTLELMQDIHSNATAFEIEEQQRKIVALRNLTEKDLKQRGIATRKAAEDTLAIERAKLATLKALNDPYYAAQIKAQEALVKAQEAGLDALESRLHAMGIVTKKDAQDRIDIEEKKLAALKALNDPYYAAQIRAQKKVVDDAKVAGGKIKVDMGGALESLTQAFTQLATISGASFGGMIKNIGEAVGGLNVMKKSFGSAIDAFKGAGTSGGLAGIKESFSGLMGGSGIGGALKGLTNGLGTVMPMVGGIISGITAAIGVGKKLWDMFTTSKGEKAAKEVGSKMGVTITEEMGDKIAKSAKDLFKGDLFAAEIYHLNDIIAAAGGVTEKNFDKLFGNLSQTFALVKQGKMTADQAREVLDQNFGAFAKHVLESGKIASKAFTDLIRMNAEMGTQSKEVMAFVEGQSTRLGGALTKMLGTLDVKSLEKVEDTLGRFSETGRKQLEQDYDAVKHSAEGFSGSFEDFVGQQAVFYQTLDEGDKRLKTSFLAGDLNIWKKQQGAIKQTAEDMARLERLTLAGFNAAVKSGQPYLDALNAMGPAIDKIAASNKLMGREGSAAINELMRFREVANANKELVESAGALNEVMLALSNLGGLTEETFADLQTQGMDTFTKLTEAGFTESQSLQQMKGFLEQTRDAHKQLGLPIDENTQKLIAQAEEQGILKKEQLSTNEIMLQGLSAIIEAVGGKIPAAFKTMNQSAVEVGKTLDSTSKKIADAPWAGYAAKAAAAGATAGKAVGGVTNSVDGVAQSLDDTNWEGWSEEAVAAAKAAKAAVDAVAVGESPGGIKDIPLKLNAAIAAFKQWEKQGIISSESVKASVEAVSGGAIGGAVTAARAGAQAAASGGGGAVNLHEGAIVIERPILKDRESMRDLARDISRELRDALSPLGLW